MTVPTVAEDIVAQIRELAGQGWTTREIGARLGRSRGSIIGLCHRRGIELQHNPGNPRAAPRTSSPASAANHTPAPEEAPRRARPHDGGPREGGCRFPLWGDEPPTHRYCGKRPARSGAAYCDKHEGVCYARGANRTREERLIKRLAASAGGPRRNMVGL